MGKWLKLSLFLLGMAASTLWAADNEPKVNISTTPLGSPFLRHLAHDYKMNLRDLIKFERRGFARTEIISIALIAEKTGKPLKEYGKRRIKNKVLLRDLAQEAGMDYSALYRKSREIKAAVEAKGAENLPPPVFEEKPKNEKTPEPGPKEKDLEFEDKPRSENP